MIGKTLSCVIHTYYRLSKASVHDEKPQTVTRRLLVQDPRPPSLPLPGSGTEVLAIGDRLSDVTTSTIEGSADNGGSPVVGHARARELHAEEDDNGAERKTNVPSGRGDVVVLHPPSTVLVTDVLVECPADQAPGEL